MDGKLGKNTVSLLNFLMLIMVLYNGYKRTGTYVCIWLIHFGVQQKLTQYCEAIILQ